MKKKEMIKTKNIYAMFIGIIVFLSIISTVYATGSSYSSSIDNEIKNNIDNIIVQELNPNNVNEDLLGENDLASKAAADSNRYSIETLRIYSATSFIQGFKEIPRVRSNAFAIGEFLIDIQSNRLTYNLLEFSIQNETRAEILGPASSTMSSSNVLLTLPSTPLYKTGIWNYPQSIELDLLKGKTYINIYTTQNPNGEIRGQILPTKVYVVRRVVSIPDANKYYADIRNLSFIPNIIRIKKGDTVIWKNYDTSYHTVNSDSGYELNSGIIRRGYSYSHRFNNIGNYTYHCNLHPSIHGTVIVEN